MTASYLSGYCSEGADRDRSMSGDSVGLRFRPSRRNLYQQQSTTGLCKEKKNRTKFKANRNDIFLMLHLDQETTLTWIPETTTSEVEASPEVTIVHGTEIEEHTVVQKNVKQEEGFLGVPSSISASGSADTLVPSGPSSPSNISNVTLVGSTGSGDKNDETEPSFKYGKAPTSPLPERIIPKRPPRTIEQQSLTSESTTITITKSQQLPQTTTVKSISDTKPSIIKIAPPVNVSTNTVTITASTLIATSAVTASSTTKTIITAPSIGVKFDRYLRILIMTLCWFCFLHF